MTTIYPDIVNYTTPHELFIFTNIATDFWFGWSILILTWLIVYLALKEVWQTRRAGLAASWLAAIVSILLHTMGVLTTFAMILAMIICGVLAMFSKLSEN